MWGWEEPLLREPKRVTHSGWGLAGAAWGKGKEASNGLWLDYERPWTSGFKSPNFIPWSLGSHGSFFSRGVIFLYHHFWTWFPHKVGGLPWLPWCLQDVYDEIEWHRVTTWGLGMNAADQYFETRVACLPLKRTVLQSLWRIVPRRKKSKVSIPREHNSGHMFQ